LGLKHIATLLQIHTLFWLLRADLGEGLRGPHPPYFREVFLPWDSLVREACILPEYFIDFPYASIRVFAETVLAPSF
jgi:hypothetical protein